MLGTAESVLASWIDRVVIVGTGKFAIELVTLLDKIVGGRFAVEERDDDLILDGFVALPNRVDDRAFVADAIVVVSLLYL